MTDEPIDARRHEIVPFPDNELGREIAAEVCMAAPEQPQRRDSRRNAEPEQDRLKRIVGKGQPRCCHIEYRNNEIAYKGQRQKHDLVEFIMLGNVPVAVSAPRIAKANGAPRDHKQDPNELAGKDRHHLTPALTPVIAGLDPQVYPTCGASNPRTSGQARGPLQSIPLKRTLSRRRWTTELGYTRVRQIS